MQRKVSVYTIVDNRPVRLSHLIATVCGYRYDRDNAALVINGCGFDAGTEIACSVSYALFGTQGGNRLNTDSL